MKREKLIYLIFSQSLSRANAIVVLEGDGYFRLPYAAKLFKLKLSSRIVVSGGLDNSAGGSFPARKLASKLRQLGVPANRIILEEKSLNTREQAVEVMNLAKKYGWKQIILVASAYHQMRVFLTFLKAAQKAKLKLQIINAPARDLPWFKKNRWGVRFQMLETEARKIKLYQRDLSSLGEAIKYFKLQEKSK